MRSSTSLQAVIAGSLLVFAGTAVGLESTKAPNAKPGAAVSRPHSSSGEGKRTASPPKKGTRATGDEDETDDLEIQRNKRTAPGASKPGGLVKGPKPPHPPQDKNAIPVKIPR